MNKETGHVVGGTKATQPSVLRRNWWVLALVVLVALVLIIYLLSRLSAADSEMYPTTRLGQQLSLYLC